MNKRSVAGRVEVAGGCHLDQSIMLWKVTVGRADEPTPSDTLTLSGRIAEFRARLLQRGGFSFRAAILECRNRLEIVISFMAVLELLKSGECDARQSDHWGDIDVVALAPAA